MIGSHYFSKVISTEHYPIGSKIRNEKATKLGNSVFKTFIYLSFTITMYQILRNSDFLIYLFGGNETDPQYWKNYPC